MLGLILASIVLLCSLSLTAAECPNACSSHGRCGAYDMCVCYRNWMANDCSQRVCQFGLAHVDTPMGDLDSSGGMLSGPDATKIVNDVVYPFGTTEQFPAMVDSDGVPIPNTAHYYRECSNKGTCDRTSGDCTCFDGYGGSACQRATCPTSSAGVCSGHGTCETISTIAAWDNNNIYNLWDEHATMGCVCDGGYTGPDCSQRTCKVGPDPLYYDDAANVRVSNFTIQFFVNEDKLIIGNYSIIFFDSYGEDWQTVPIDINADCNVIVAALEGIPNGVIPSNSVRCFRIDSANTVGFTPTVYTDDQVAKSAKTFIRTRYTVAFTQNFGRLKQPEINIYLDGTRPTLYTDEANENTLGYHVYPNGFIGEEDDLVPDQCEGVLVAITTDTGYHKITPDSVDQMKLLKKCLGSADGDGVSNVGDVYNWDHGTKFNPHLVKLIEATQESLALNTPDLMRDPSLYDYPVSRLCDRTGTFLEREILNVGLGFGWCANRNPAGFFVVMYLVNAADTFFTVLTRPGVDYSGNTKFHIYTTKGYLQLVNPNAGVFTHTFPKDNNVASGVQYAKDTHSRTLYLANNTGVADFKGQVDCETAPKGTFGSLDCINKNDYVMILNNELNALGLAANPIYPNMYKVSKIFRQEKKFYGTEGLDNQNPQNEVARHQIILDYGMNTKYVQQTSSYTASVVNGPEAVIYKFHPVAPYNYVGECSNRGICDSGSGICSCFRGYTGDNCGMQNALSK